MRAKIFLGLGLVFMVVLMATACAFGPANEPKAIAEAFLGDLKNTDFKKASTYATDSAKQLLLLMESLKENAPKDELEKSRALKLAINKVDVVGNTSRVEYQLGSDPVQYLDLVKIDGVWKVDFKKQI